MTTRTRLLLALGATLALVGLAWACPPDGESRGPAVLSILGKWHLLALHLPAALLLVLPAVEWLNPAEEPSRPVRHLADLAAAGTWAATGLGILHGHFNGFSGTDVDQHLRLGVVAAALAALSWAMMGTGRRTRLTLQGLALLGTVLAAHIGGEMVHEEGFLTTPSRSKPKDEARSLDTPANRGFALFTAAYAADPAPAPAFSPNAANTKLAESLAHDLGVTAVTRSVEADAGILVATHAVAAQFDDARLSRLSAAATEIAELDLSRSRITDAAAGSLGRFARVEALSLAETQCGDAVASALAKLPGLRRLVLRGTRLTDAGLSALAKAPALEALYIADTACTPSAIEALRKSRPGLRVVGKVTLTDMTAPTPPTKDEMAKAAEALRKK